MWILGFRVSGKIGQQKERRLLLQLAAVMDHVVLLVLPISDHISILRIHSLFIVYVYFSERYNKKSSHTLVHQFLMILVGAGLTFQPKAKLKIRLFRTKMFKIDILRSMSFLEHINVKSLLCNLNLCRFSHKSSLLHYGWVKYSICLLQYSERFMNFQQSLTLFFRTLKAPITLVLGWWQYGFTIIPYYFVLKAFRDVQMLHMNWGK